MFLTHKKTFNLNNPIKIQEIKKPQDRYFLMEIKMLNK